MFFYHFVDHDPKVEIFEKKGASNKGVFIDCKIKD